MFFVLFFNLENVLQAKQCICFPQVAHSTPIYSLCFKEFQVKGTAYAKNLGKKGLDLFKEQKGGLYIQS